MEDRQGEIGGEWTAGGESGFDIHGVNGFLASGAVQEITGESARCTAGEDRHPQPLLTPGTLRGQGMGGPFPAILDKLACPCYSGAGRVSSTQPSVKRKGKGPGSFAL